MPILVPSYPAPAHDPAPALPSPSFLEEIRAGAWGVLEMHFLTRPHLISEARARLDRCLLDLWSQASADDVAQLKDRACRAVQLHYGPATAPAPSACAASEPMRRSAARVAGHLPRCAA